MFSLPRDSQFLLTFWLGLVWTQNRIWSSENVLTTSARADETHHIIKGSQFNTFYSRMGKKLTQKRWPRRILLIYIMHVKLCFNFCSDYLQLAGTCLIFLTKLNREAKNYPRLAITESLMKLITSFEVKHWKRFETKFLENDDELANKLVRKLIKFIFMQSITSM